MLARLSVRNLAIVESVEAEFGEGLNIITGETGAGKSVLMGALELALGARADSSAVRDGAKEAVVAAEFALGGGAATEAVGRILEDAGLPASRSSQIPDARGNFLHSRRYYGKIHLASRRRRPCARRGAVRKKRQGRTS